MDETKAVGAKVRKIQKSLAEQGWVDFPDKVEARVHVKVEASTILVK